jgi:hypothetical protein
LFFLFFLVFRRVAINPLFWPFRAFRAVALFYSFIVFRLACCFTCLPVSGLRFVIAGRFVCFGLVAFWRYRLPVCVCLSVAPCRAF